MRHDDNQYREDDISTMTTGDVTLSYVFDKPYSHHQLAEITEEAALALLNASPYRRLYMEAQMNDYGRIVDACNKLAFRLEQMGHHAVWVYKHDDMWFLTREPQQ